MLSTVVFAGVGCSKGSGKRRIAVIPKGESHDFWKSVHYGAAQAGEQYGVEIVWQGTPNEKQEHEQRKIAETLISQDVDGICLAPINRTIGGDIVTTAKRKGIPTVIFDSGIDDDSEIVSYVATNNLNGGKIAGERLATIMKKKGGVILLRYQQGSESTEQREKGFLETIAKYPDIEVLSETERIDSDVAAAKKASGVLLKKYKDKVTGVFTVCEPNNKGMSLAMAELVKAGDLKPNTIKFVAFDSDPLMIEGLANGTVHGVVLQNPVKMGFQSVEAMVQHLDKKEVKKRIETGEELATPENRNEEKFAALLKPKRFGE